jgi:hypothetical protein
MPVLGELTSGILLCFYRFDSYTTSKTFDLIDDEVPQLVGVIGFDGKVLA